MMNAENLKKFRESMNIRTKIEMSRILGVDKGTYIKWENGARKMPAIADLAIHAVLFMSKAGLLDSFLKYFNKKVKK